LIVFFNTFYAAPDSQSPKQRLKTKPLFQPRILKRYQQQVSKLSTTPGAAKGAIRKENAFKWQAATASEAERKFIKD